MPSWTPVSFKIWRGRDDSLEGSIAKRLFQTVLRSQTFSPQSYPEKIALIGFECDEGVRLNKGIPGAKEAPDAIRKAMANLAAHVDHDKIVDLGNLEANEGELEAAQLGLAEHVRRCHEGKMKTIVLGGGHETAYGHGLGIYQAHPDAVIGIINFDAHLDIRNTGQASSGTPFKQLADVCEETDRPFKYMCVGANLASNTLALLQVAEDLGVKIIWDTDCQQANYENVVKQVNDFIDSVDLIYLTVDLDALPSNTMSAVSAPATLGVQFHFLLALAEEIKRSGKMCAADFVEYSPGLDSQRLCAKVAARFVWQICLGWASLGKEQQ